MRTSILALIVFALAHHAATAAPAFTSGNERVALVELYTSEGCSSCPPADRRLSALVDEPALWSEFVPVALHVDYWDRLGWKDRFADARFSQRQRHYAAYWGNSVVYTPSFVVNGERKRSAAESGAGGNPGVLRAKLSRGEVSVRFSPKRPSARPRLVHAALLGFGLTTDVGAGENRGRRLHHDFVALRYASGELEASGDGGYRASIPLERPAIGERQALAVWVAGSRDPTPLQAVGGWLPPRRAR